MSHAIWIRFTSLLLLVWFPLLVVLPWIGSDGVLPALDGSGEAERFPCEAHRCGCEGAGECWDVCCCFAPLEMAAWALRAGVSLPPEMEEYAALVPIPVPGESEAVCCTGASVSSEQSEAFTQSRYSSLLAAPADPFSCKGIVLGLLLQGPVAIAAASALNLPAPRVATFYAMGRSSAPQSPFLEQPEHPPRRPLFC